MIAWIVLKFSTYVPSHVSYSSQISQILPENVFKVYKGIENILNKENEASSTKIYFRKRKATLPINIVRKGIFNIKMTNFIIWKSFQKELNWKCQLNPNKDMLHLRLNMGLISRIYIHYYGQICVKLDHRLREIRPILL